MLKMLPFLRCKRYTFFRYRLRCHQRRRRQHQQHRLIFRSIERAELLIESRWRKKKQNIHQFHVQRQNQRTSMTDQIYSCRCRRLRSSSHCFCYYYYYFHFILLILSLLTLRHREVCTRLLLRWAFTAIEFDIFSLFHRAVSFYL